jgi:uncharacterized protein YdaU (DUF1376 family)
LKKVKTMHYYPHHIGDFIKATARLSDSQAMAYLRLLWMYYDSEKPLKPDTKILAFQIGASQEDTQLLLDSYFVLCDVGWTQTRCDKEIQEYRDLLTKKSTAGKASAEQRRNKRLTDVEQVLNGRSTDVQLTNNQEPITNNQEPVIKEGKPSLSGTTFPPCPHTELLKLWNKHLPHLTQPRTWEGNRQANMRQRWIQAGKPSSYSPDGYKTTEDGLRWWDSFFGYIATDTSLPKGFDTKGRTWRPDLEWVVNATNFQKIIDGKYNK